MESIQTGEDGQAVREKLRLSQVELASQLGVSARHVRRQEAKDCVELIYGLALEGLLSRRAASTQKAVSPEERAERKFREQEHLRQLRAEAGVPSRGLTPDQIAERRLAVEEATQRLREARGLPVGKVRSQLETRDTKRRVALIRARNKLRERDRPDIAVLHAQLIPLAIQAQADGDWAPYEKALDMAVMRFRSEDHYFVNEYIDAARRSEGGPVSSADPAYTVPLEDE